MHIRKFDNLPVLIAQDKIPNTSYQQEKLNNTASATQVTSANKKKIISLKPGRQGRKQYRTWVCPIIFANPKSVGIIHVKFCDWVKSEHR